MLGHPPLAPAGDKEPGIGWAALATLLVSAFGLWLIGLSGCVPAPPQPVVPDTVIAIHLDTVYLGGMGNANAYTICENGQIRIVADLDALDGIDGPEIRAHEERHRWQLEQYAPNCPPYTIIGRLFREIDAYCHTIPIHLKAHPDRRVEDVMLDFAERVVRGMGYVVPQDAVDYLFVEHCTVAMEESG